MGILFFFTTTMDALSQYVEDNLITEETILNLVDDYSIYCYYLQQELELGVRYSSPLREGDANPSFVLFDSDRSHSILYKDYAVMGSVGNVFKFIGQYLDLDHRAVLRQINSDMGLGLDGVEVGKVDPIVHKRIKLVREKVKIEITSKKRHTTEFLEFWAEYGISLETLKWGQVHEVDVLHFSTASSQNTVIPKPVCIAYRIFDKYKIYQPNEPEYKFTNDFENTFVEGAVQLSFTHEFVIITKAMKEVLFFKEHFDFEAIAGKSETQMINDWFLQTHIFPNFERVYICLDQDTAGRHAQTKYIEKYPQLIPIEFNPGLGGKDLTDVYKAISTKEKVLKWIKSLFI